MPAGYEPNPALGQTYGGFAGPRPAQPARAPLSRKLIAGGAVGAIALGLVVGLWAKPHIAVAEHTPMEPVSVPAGQLDIVIDTPPPTPVQPVSTAPLEVLPSDMAAAGKSKSVVAPPPRRPAPPPEPVLTPAVAQITVPAPTRPKPAAPMIEARPEPRLARFEPVRARPQTIVDCRDPADPEEVAICRDIGALPRAPMREDWARYGD